MSYLDTLPLQPTAYQDIWWPLTSHFNKSHLLVPKIYGIPQNSYNSLTQNN